MTYINQKGEKFDVKTLHKLTGGMSSKSYDINNFIHILDQPVWWYYRKPITPRQVLNDRTKYVGHFKRIVNSNLKYPLLITQKGTLANGFHRLISAFLKGNTTIEAITVPNTILKKAQINK